MNHPQNVERRLRDEIKRLRAEAARLTGCLSAANSQFEEYERRYYLEQDRAESAERERDALRARIEGAAVAWAGVAQNGLWYAGQDWRDSAHVKLHLSGFGDAEDQKSIKTCRVALVVVE